MRRPLFVLPVFLLLAFAALGSVATATPVTTVVKPSSMHGWLFYDDQHDLTATATGSMVAGPGTPPLGTGSAHLSVSGTSDGQALLMPFPETRLDTLTSLQYSTYQPGPTLAIAFSFDIKLRPADSSYDGRLVFEPYQNGTVSVGSGWQTWSPLTGKWWASHQGASNGTNGLCPIGAPCDWATVLTDFPDATISGNIVFKAGSNWSSFDGNVDALTIGVSGADATYDFEPETPCTTVCYVDGPNGNDLFGGDTPSTAKKTIQAAVDTVSANGTVRVLPGSYAETALNRDLTHDVGGATYNFGLYFGTPGVKLIGVTAGDVAITDASATQADVDHGWRSGLWARRLHGRCRQRHHPGPPDQRQPRPGLVDRERQQDDRDPRRQLHAQDSTTNVPAGGGSVYINDWSAGGTVVKAYHVLDNVFPDGTSVDISSGAGSSGPLSDREIKGNHFDLNDNGYNGISFNGSGTAVPWYSNTVGGAVISGNTFANSTQYIRSRGTIVDAEFLWADWFNDNTFDGAVMAGPDPANGDLTAYDYDCGYGPSSCPNTKRITSTIQGSIDHAAANDIVLVKADTYNESPNIDRSLTLQSQSGRNTTTIQLQTGPTYLGSLTSAPVTTSRSTGSPSRESTARLPRCVVEHLPRDAAWLGRDQGQHHRRRPDRQHLGQRRRRHGPAHHLHRDDSDEVDSVNVHDNMFEPLKASPQPRLLHQPRRQPVHFANNQIDWQLRGLFDHRAARRFG